jgi:chemotaxis protein MotA
LLVGYMALPRVERSLVRPVVLPLAAAALVGVLAFATGFLDPLSLLITVGGALAVTRLTYPAARLQSAWRQVAAALADEGGVPEDVIAALKRLARIHRVDGELALELAAAAEPDPLVRRAVELAVECRDDDELADVLSAEGRRETAEGEAARQVLVTMGRLFPAFGLIGTLIGLVLLMRRLTDGTVAAIGPGLGVSILTTLYGALFANAVLLPLAGRLHAHLVRRALRAQMIADGVALVRRRVFPTRIERLLRGYVGPAGGTCSGRVVGLTDRAA